MSHIASHRDAPAGVAERALSLWPPETDSAREKSRRDSSLRRLVTTRRALMKSTNGAEKPAEGFAVFQCLARDDVTARPLLDPMAIPDTEKARKALKVDEIRDLLEEAGLDTAGTKPVLLARLEEVRMLFESRSRSNAKPR